MSILRLLNQLVYYALLKNKIAYSIKFEIILIIVIIL
jgi:hypothetical protein